MFTLNKFLGDISRLAGRATIFLSTLQVHFEWQRRACWGPINVWGVILQDILRRADLCVASFIDTGSKVARF